MTKKLTKRFKGQLNNAYYTLHTAYYTYGLGKNKIDNEIHRVMRLLAENMGE